MEFRRDQPGGRASGTMGESASTETAELDLYDELLSFTTLSPEEQSKELERVTQASAQPAAASEESAPASFEFLEPADSPASESSSSEPAFNLIDESVLAPACDDSSQPIPSLEETAQQPSEPGLGGHVTDELADTLRKTSPLEDIYPDAIATPETSLKCGGCGAGSNLDDLFCPSCGQLLSEMDL